MDATTVPVPLTPLVGRRDEIAAITAILTQPETRLLTLTGTGGTGKTRLAVEIARTVGFPNGVVFVPLAALTDAAMMSGAIANVIGLRVPRADALTQRLIEHFRSLDCLLVLDGLEHLLPDAAAAVATLLSSCSALRVLATSQAALKISGEREFSAPPLELPDPARLPPLAALIEVESVRLFLERARAVRPTFEITTTNMVVVAEICRRLDGLPLAIELAAARIKFLMPEELAARLDRRLPLLTGGPIDLPKRQRTLHDTIAWSYDLLTDEEQELFCRLAVFCGGFALDAAEAVAGKDGAGEGVSGEGGKENESSPPYPFTPSPALPDVLDGVASLVDKSLLRLVDREGDAPRYSMLETVREFALERLEESGQARGIKTKHALWYLDQSERLWVAIIRGPTHVPWLTWAETEHDNLGAALAWFDESGDTEHLLLMVGSIWPFWMVRNHLTEWMSWVERALPLADQAPLAIRARFLQSASAQYFHYPLLDRRQIYREAMAAFEELGDEWGVAASLHQGGSQALADGRYDEAGELLERALEIFERLSVADWFAFVMSRLGEVALGKGDLAAARATLERSLELNLAMDEPWVGATNLNNLALIALEEHRREDAVERMTAALAQLKRTRDVAGLASWLALAAMLSNEGWQYVQAARLFGARAETMSRQDLIPKLPQQAIYERTISSLRMQMGEFAFNVAFQEGLGTDLDEAIQLAESALADPSSVSGQEPRPGGLTAREVTILELLAGGGSNQEIADALSISTRTVERHIGNVYLKIGAHNRAEATAYAFRRGIALDSLRQLR